MHNRLLVNFGIPDDPGEDSHLLGLVAECLWFELTGGIDSGIGLPVLIEGHDWSVTDPGGDGLAVYRGAGVLQYRLWESKAHGTVAVVRETVNGACTQLKRRALEYLGRYAVVAQRVTDDDELADFLCGLPEMWVNNSPQAGVGVSVAAPDAADATLCFERLPEYFTLDGEAQRGHLNVVAGNLLDFAKLVRAFIWDGAGLCDAP
jgi:hypothetical protein